MGDFSYSLYLMHPVALAVTGHLLPAGMLPRAILVTFDILAAIAMSRLFFQLVERHFLNTAPRAEPK
jgi:peptidoglycan/LPS O-acetylase OafA/YrhL